MGGLRFTRGDLATYALLSKAGSDIKDGMRQHGMTRASEVTPETISDTQLTETTPGTEDMIYDSDSGQYLPKYLGKNSQPTEQAQTQLNTPADGESESPDGVLPSFTAKTAKSYKMGNKVQDTPFSQEQVDAQRFRNQADVSSRFGNFREAAALQGLSKVREEEGVTTQIKNNVELGLSRDHSDLKGMDREWKQIALAAEANLKAGRYNEYAALAKGAEGLQGKLLNNAMDKADLLTDPHAKLTAQLDAYNRYVLDARTGGGVTKNQDDSFTIKLSDGGEFTAKSDEDIAKVGMYLRDPGTVRKLQQEAYVKRRDREASREDKAWEWQNKPMEVGKDSTVFQPSTGKTFSPGNARGFDPKEAGQVLDDTRKILLERSGNFDQATGKWNWSPETTTKAVVAERLFMKNPTLGPSQLADIADNGKIGIAEIEVGGKRQKVQAVTHNGNTYLLGGGDAGHAMPGAPGKAAAPQVTTTGLGTRDVRGKISPAPGAPGLTPIAPQRKAEPVAYNAPELDKLAVAAAEETGVPPKLLLAVKNAGEKSNNDQVSKKGASGVMQFMPETAKAYGVDPTNPESAIRGAGRYLAELIKQYRGNVAAAVAHYNGGATQGTLVAAGKEPTYPETRAYLERVLAAAG